MEKEWIWGRGEVGSGGIETGRGNGGRDVMDETRIKRNVSPVTCCHLIAALTALLSSSLHAGDSSNNTHIFSICSKNKTSNYFDTWKETTVKILSSPKIKDTKTHWGIRQSSVDKAPCPQLTHFSTEVASLRAM